MSARVACLLLALLLAPLRAWAPGDGRPATAYAVVALAARQHQMPLPLLWAVWTVESSRRLHPPRGRHGERGAFQVRRIAAREARCDWARLEGFVANADCAARILRMGLARCGTASRAAAYYNTGSCPATDVPGPYRRKLHAAERAFHRRFA